MHYKMIFLKQKSLDKMLNISLSQTLILDATIFGIQEKSWSIYTVYLNIQCAAYQLGHICLENFIICASNDFACQIFWSLWPAG